jgi:hypothetical protein
MKQTIDNVMIGIFKDIDNAINTSIRDKPKKISESEFIKKYLKIKNKWLKPVKCKLKEDDN